MNSSLSQNQQQSSKQYQKGHWSPKLNQKHGPNLGLSGKRPSKSGNGPGIFTYMYLLLLFSLLVFMLDITSC